MSTPIEKKMMCLFKSKKESRNSTLFLLGFIANQRNQPKKIIKKEVKKEQIHGGTITQKPPVKRIA